MKIERIGKYRIESFEQNGKILVKIFNENARKEWKQQIAYYSFNTEEQREKYIETFKTNAQRRINEKEERKQIRKNFKNPAKVEDILYSSWGYDQTNIDFYQVVEVKGKSVVIREIAAKSVEGSLYSHGMADMVVPKKGVFVEKSPEMLRRVAPSSYDSYSVSIKDFIDASPTSETEQHYRSWYA